METNSNIKNTDIAVIGEAGAMRNAVVAGFAIGSGLRISECDAYYAVSSAVGNGAYFLAGQTEEARRVWVHELTSPRVFSFQNFVSTQRYFADIDYLVDHAAGSLNVKKMQEQDVRFIIGTVHRKTGKPTFFDAHGDIPFRTLFKATVSVPGLARPVEINGEKYVDGGVVDPLPVLQAYRDGHKNFIVLSNTPRTYRFSVESLPFLYKLAKKGVRKAIEERRNFYQEAWDFIEKPSADIRVFKFYPPKTFYFNRFERDPKRVETALEFGMLLGRDRAKELHEFVRSCKE